MNKRTKNLSMIGAVLAVTFFLCGMFHHALLAGCLAIADTVSEDNPFWLYVCWMAPISLTTVAIMEWQHRHQKFLN
jgi:hypothetical protein